MEYKTNICQTPITEELLNSLNEEVREAFIDIINNIPYVNRLISPDRPRAKDLPRDEEGKIIVDITLPHILEDMDYFRPSALYYKANGVYTKLKPNSNPNSLFGKWIREEIRRCYHGYVRPSDGEWIPGDLYFFLNYCPILLASKEDKNSKRASRISDFPRFWEGHYYKAHYIHLARLNGKFAFELASRGKGKSFYGAAMLAKRFILGEDEKVNKRVLCVVTALERKYIQGANQILDMFLSYIDFLADNTLFPSRRLVSSINNLLWTMGYIDLNTNTKKGTQNSVSGFTSGDDESKLRGTRGVLYIIEEMGTFVKFLDVFNLLRPSVEDGDDVWGLIYAYGTTGSKEADFSSAKELVCNPLGYNIYAVLNVYDKEGLGKPNFIFFFPGYINRALCYDENGNSDVVKAIIQILKDRYNIKYNSTNPNTVAVRVAEIPITPSDALLKTINNIFPVLLLLERLLLIDNNPAFYNDVYVGHMVLRDGEVSFTPGGDVIRNFPHKDNKLEGAIEIYKMPEKDKNGKVLSNRYIAALDPVDDDGSETMSLLSGFILDLFTDDIVAEYTGRPLFADDYYELFRLLLIFYNATCNYENNKKGLYSYFSKTNSTYLLSPGLEFLKDKDIIGKLSLLGNKLYGTNATAPVNAYARRLIKYYLMKPRLIKVDELEMTIPTLYTLKGRALLQELSMWNQNGNFDRVSSLGMLMLLRESELILCGETPIGTSDNTDYLGDDPFFKINYDDKFSPSKANSLNIIV